jgi:hypothetical protein
MKFAQDRPYARPEAAARRLLEIANATDADQGKVDVGQVNIVFLREGSRPDEYRAGMEHLKADGLIEMHPSGACFTFTEKGAQRFA